MAKKIINTTALTGQIETKKDAPAEKTEKKAPATKRGQSPKSKKALEKARAERVENAENKRRKYMQLDIGDYEDYLKRMSQIADKEKEYKQKDKDGNYVTKTRIEKGIPVTKYILQLIKKDMQENLETYNKLRELDTFTKKERESWNRGMTYTINKDEVKPKK